MHPEKVQRRPLEIEGYTSDDGEQNAQNTSSKEVENLKFLWAETKPTLS